MAGSADAERAYLKKESVYEHLGKIIDRVVAEKPQDAYGLLEVISRQVKASVAAGQVPEAPAEEELSPADQAKALEEYFKGARALDAVPKDEAGEPVQVCHVPDFVEEAETLSWAGVGFGQLESYRIMCSLRNLAHKEAEAGLSKLRFWGKILGAGADYFVAEATRPEGDAPEGEEDTEQPGVPGANQYAYYVTNDLTGAWHKLPEVRPTDIVAARGIRRLLTGDVGAKVVTHPDFDGPEARLLRAQIARIRADTNICLRGYLRREGEDGEEEVAEDAAIEENPDFAGLPPAEALRPDGWTHMAHHLLQNGRTVHKEIPDDLEDDEKAKIQEQQDADPPKDMIRSVADDELEWSIKQTGDPSVYKDPAKSTCVTYVRSLTWPGAVCAARGKHFTNLYVGYGLPAREPDFFPPEPPDVQDEPVDPGEQKQPPGTEEAEEPKEEDA